MSNIPCSADNNPEKYPETVCQEYNCTGGADDIRFFFKKVWSVLLVPLSGPKH